MYPNLYHGDCLEVMKTLPDGSVDMILCDLPYGTTQCKWDVVIPFEPMWMQYERIIKKTGAIVLFACQPFTCILGASKIELLKYSWVWEKTKPTNFINAKRQPLRGFEDILVFYRQQPTYNPQGILRVNRHRKNSGTSARTIQDKEVAVHDGGLFQESWTQQFTNYPRGLILEAENGRSDSVHPTQKPVALLEYFIKTYTNEGDTVLDNCMGSGSTGVAAMNLKRKFIGIELDATYFEIAQKRVTEAIKS
jgi:site-specific DNA-methyltransferase (adenine-specific)